MTIQQLMKLGFTEDQAKQLQRNSKYWTDRFNAIEQREHNKGLQCLQDIEDQYQRAQKQIEAQIATWYQRFADNNKISLADARKMLSEKELKEFKWDVNDYIRYGEQNAIDGQWCKQLENASARFHVSRLEALRVQMQQAVEVLYGGQLDSLDDTIRNIYTDGYYRTAFEIQKGIGVGWDFSKLDQRQIDKVINHPWASSGDRFSDTFWKNKQHLLSEMDKELTQGIILGKDPQKIIDAMSTKLNAKKNVTGRLVMTESAYFSEQAQHDCFKELDVEEYEIVATLDSRTSEICQEMDGKVFKMSEWDVGITAPPFHPWCRTTTVPHFDDDFGVQGERAARGSDGKTYMVPADMTYKEWKNKFVKSRPIEGIRELVEPKFNSTVTGCKAVEGGFKVESSGQGVKLITLNKMNSTAWDDLPEGTKDQLKYTPMHDKAFRFAKGEYSVQRYIEGSIENLERDEIAQSIGAEYLGFTFQTKNGQSLYIDFYQKGDDLLYSIGKADIQKTINADALDELKKVVHDREDQIIQNIGESNLSKLPMREGDEWVSAMREFHRAINADGKPVILSDDDYDALGSPVLYRGIAPQSRLRADITTDLSTKEMAKEFFEGDSPFPSRGVYGDGIAYASPAFRKIAVNYATNGGNHPHGGVVIEFKLKSGAKIISYEDAVNLYREMMKTDKGKLLFSAQRRTRAEVGKAMNALGYDAILKHDGDGTGEDFYVILNRGALVTKKKCITKMM